MLSRFRNFRRSTHTSPKQPLPHVAWLPPELIIHIWKFLSLNTTSNQSLAGLARVCRGWHSAAIACIYECVAPANRMSCKLLIRSLEKDPHLSGLIKSIIFPYDYELLSPQAPDVKRPTIMQKLVTKCASLRDLWIPMSCAVEWTDDLLKDNLPHMATLENLRNLTIMTFDIKNPARPRHIPAQYVSMWLCQVPALPRLETLALCVAFSPWGDDWTYPWPSMPRLHRLHFDHPSWYILPEIHPLLPQVRDSLKSLHITGLVEMSPFIYPTIQSEFARGASQFLLNTLEELVLTHPAPRHSIILDSRSRDGLEHMVSLRHLHISEWMFHPDILLKPPPLLAALTITLHRGHGSPPLDIRSLFQLLPSTVKTLTIKTPRYMWKGDFDKYILCSTQATSIYPVDNEARANTFKREMYRIAAHWGIDFQIQENRGMCQIIGVGAFLDCSQDSESFHGKSCRTPPVPRRSSALFKKFSLRRR